jgi:hypothetical protein
VPIPATRPANERRHGGRKHDLAEDAVELAAVSDPLDPSYAEAGDGGTDEDTEQGVRRGRRQTEQPGEQVPDDAADEAGQDDEQQRRASVGE